MHNFNTARGIDIREYLPDYLKNIREYKTLANVENTVVRDLWKSAENCMNDQFISESTEIGITLREKMLGITPYATDTLDDRKFRIFAKYAENVPYTKSSLKKMLSSLCGDDGFSLWIDTAQKNVVVKIALTSKKQQKSIEELLERVLPYSMTFSAELMYNTWGRINELTWKQLKGSTWGEIKEKESLIKWQVSQKNTD